MSTLTVSIQVPSGHWARDQSTLMPQITAIEYNMSTTLTKNVNTGTLSFLHK